MNQNPNSQCRKGQAITWWDNRNSDTDETRWLLLTPFNGDMNAKTCIQLITRPLVLPLKIWKPTFNLQKRRSLHSCCLDCHIISIISWKIVCIHLEVTNMETCLDYILHTSKKIIAGTYHSPQGDSHLQVIMAIRAIFVSYLHIWRGLSTCSARKYSSIASGSQEQGQDTLTYGHGHGHETEAENRSQDFEAWETWYAIDEIEHLSRRAKSS